MHSGGEMSELGNEARRFVRGQHQGVLSTLSQRLPGYPFGSVTPFMLDQMGRPVILISTLAEHTKNIDADPRVSLIVQPFTPDPQEAGRVTLVGRAERLPTKDTLGPRYLRYFPQAENYFAMHDFHFYRIEPERIRYIGGFGKIHWIEAEAFLAEANALAEQETGILEHMNADHVEALRDYCRHFHGITPDRAEMIGIDGDGFDVRADDRVLRFTFAEPIRDAAGARTALVAMVQQCRT
ncbi:MAG: HugZ family protein [Hydrogenophilaceae bacterium]|nr:HugZ family protein [Hydrogenophilaceae bacterium]